MWNEFTAVFFKDGIYSVFCGTVRSAYFFAPALNKGATLYR